MDGSDGEWIIQHADRNGSGVVVLRRKGSPWGDLVVCSSDDEPRSGCGE